MEVPFVDQGDIHGSLIFTEGFRGIKTTKTATDNHHFMLVCLGGEIGELGIDHGFAGVGENINFYFNRPVLGKNTNRNLPKEIKGEISMVLLLEKIGRRRLI